MPVRTILLVEDHPADVELTQHALKRNNIVHELIVVRDGAEALDYLFGTGPYAGREPTDPPQVVLLDLRLPKLDGLEVLRRLRTDERTKHLPVVILSSSQDEQDLIDSYNLGASAFVRKPVGFDELVGVVRQLGLKWLS